MRTPSLRRRVILTGVLVMAVVLVAVQVAVYLAVRDRLEATLGEVLATRLDVAVDLGQELAPEALAARLQAQGVPAAIRPPDGDEFIAEPTTPRFSQGPPADPGPLGTVPLPRESRAAVLADGTEVVVFATRAGVESTLRGVLLFEVLASLGGLLVATFLLRRASDRALSPLDTVVATARRTSEGTTGERLNPDDAGTELGRMAIAFDDMLDALETALTEARTEEERSRRFLADAAHQLRTPIAGLRAAVESLLREQDPEQRDEILGTLLRETARSSRLVSALLRVARLDRGEEPNRRPTDLVALCQDEIDRAASLSPTLDVQLYLATEPPPGHVLIDPDAIREALANVLDNARRHARTHVDLTLAVQDDAVELRIADDGPGLDGPDLERAFERFTTLDGRGGSGLGLPIARGLARAHGGDLTYEDRAFVFWLPVGHDTRPA